MSARIVIVGAGQAGLSLAVRLRAQSFGGESVRVEVDKRDAGGGQK